jgi:hypothetical protein
LFLPTGSEDGGHGESNGAYSREISEPLFIGADCGFQPLAIHFTVCHLFK